MQNAFVFDTGNLSKLSIVCKRRKVELSEVITTFDDANRIILPSGIDGFTGEERFACIGESHRKRLISVIFVLRNGNIRPFNIWPTKGSKRNMYYEKKLKYDPLENPLISDKEIERAEDEMGQPISEKEFARIIKRSKKGLIKAKKHTPSKKAA